MEAGDDEVDNQEEVVRLPVPFRKDLNEYSMFESSPHYILDHLNSIAYGNDACTQTTKGFIICSKFVLVRYGVDC